MSITGSLLSHNMSRDSCSDVDSGSDSDSECDEEWNGDDYRKTEITRRASCPALNQATAMFKFDTQASSSVNESGGKFRRTLCNGSDGDSDDDIISDGEFSETAGRRTASVCGPPSHKVMLFPE